MENYDRVRENTPAEINAKLDQEMAERVHLFEGAKDELIGHRISELDREWDIERILETNASIAAFTGLALGTMHSGKWYALTAVVLVFLFQHAVQGWCPPLPVFRKMGFRTQKEIQREKYALKLLRGDAGDSARGRETVQSFTGII